MIGHYDIFIYLYVLVMVANLLDMPFNQSADIRVNHLILSYIGYISEKLFFVLCTDSYKVISIG